MPAGVLAAIAALNAILGTVSQISSMVASVPPGSDLTDAQLQTVVDARKAAEDALAKLLSA